MLLGIGTGFLFYCICKYGSSILLGILVGLFMVPMFFALIIMALVTSTEEKKRELKNAKSWKDDVVQAGENDVPSKIEKINSEMQKWNDLLIKCRKGETEVIH